MAGSVRQAEMVDEPQFAKTLGNVKGSMRRGLLYQDRVTDYLDTQIEGIAGPWFRYSNGVKPPRYAQPDWLGFDFERGFLYIAEIKLTRVTNAWWQLNRLYKPIVQKVFPKWDIVLLEVSTTADVLMLPEEVKVVHKVQDAKLGQTSLFRMNYKDEA